MSGRQWTWGTALKESAPLAATALSASVIGWVALRDVAHVAGAMGVATAGVGVLLVAPLLMPLGSLLDRARHAALLALTALAVGIVLAGQAIALPAALLFLLTCCAWLLASSALVSLKAGQQDRQEEEAGAPRFLVALGLALLISLPLWLGPFLALRGSDSQWTRAALFASPLIELASAAGWDVLHSRWLYQHTVLGALRISYPSVGGLLLTDLALLALALLLAPRDRGATLRFTVKSSVESPS